MHRFSPHHFSGVRHKDGTRVLEKILYEEMELHLTIKDKIRKLFGIKDYAEHCVRK